MPQLVTDQVDLLVKRHALPLLTELRVHSLNELDVNALEWKALCSAEKAIRKHGSDIADSIDRGANLPKDLLEKRGATFDGLADALGIISDEKDLRMELGNKGPTNTLSQRADSNSRFSTAAVDDGPNARDQHTRAFTAFLRSPTGVDTRQALAEIERREGNTLTGAAGGYVVPEIISTNIFSRARTANALGPICRNVMVASGDVRFPLNENDASAGWAAETAARTATTEPTLAARVPTFGTAYANVTFTEELASDSLINIQDWFESAVAAALGEQEQVAILSGDGSSKPTGMLNTATETGDDGSRTDGVYKHLAAASASAIAGDELLDMIYDLKSQYRANSQWIMNSATAGALRKLKDGDGRYLWADGLSMGQPATLVGYPVTIVEAMADIGANAQPVAFGDFNRGYIVAKRNRIHVTVDDNITTPGYIKLYIRQRVGGCVYDENAIRWMKMAAS